MTDFATRRGVADLGGSDDTRTLFAQTMGYVAVTVGLFRARDVPRPVLVLAVLLLIFRPW